jgi:hypothetical protein
LLQIARFHLSYFYYSEILENCAFSTSVTNEVPPQNPVTREGAARLRQSLGVCKAILIWLFEYKGSGGYHAALIATGGLCARSFSILHCLKKHKKRESLSFPFFEMFWLNV